MQTREDGWPLCPVCGEDELGKMSGKGGQVICYRGCAVDPRGLEALRILHMMDQATAKWHDECGYTE